MPMGMRKASGAQPALVDKRRCRAEGVVVFMVGSSKRGLEEKRWVDFKSLTLKDKHAPMRLTVPYMETNHDGPV